jgi:hypothetical protein
LLKDRFSEQFLHGKPRAIEKHKDTSDHLVKVLEIHTLGQSVSNHCLSALKIPETIESPLRIQDACRGRKGQYYSSHRA